MKHIPTIELAPEDSLAIRDLVVHALKCDPDKISDKEVWSNFMDETTKVCQAFANQAFSVGFEAGRKYE